MESEAIHDLTAAYALDALDAREERVYEDHLAHCERCQAELASMSDAAAALAFAADASTTPPPPELRDRILDSARAERSNVVPLRRRWTAPLGIAAALAACAAVVLGVWAISAQRSLDRDRAALEDREAALALLAAPGAQARPLDGASGSLVVAPNGDGALVVSGLGRAPDGRTYQAWVIEGDGAPQPAGLFDGGDLAVVRLTRPVPRERAVVAVTLERDGGADAPTAEPLFASTA